MMELALTFCLLSAPQGPGSCTTRFFPTEQSPTACMLSAQQYAVQWLEDHPRYGLKSWHCGEQRT